MYARIFQHVRTMHVHVHDDVRAHVYMCVNACVYACQCVMNCPYALALILLNTGCVHTRNAQKTSPSGSSIQFDLIETDTHTHMHTQTHTHKHTHTHWSLETPSCHTRSSHTQPQLSETCTYTHIFFFLRRSQETSPSGCGLAFFPDARVRGVAIPLSLHHINHHPHAHTHTILNQISSHTHWTAYVWVCMNTTFQLRSGHHWHTGRKCVHVYA